MALVDVRDVAFKMMFASIQMGKAYGPRCICSSSQAPRQVIADIITEEYPERKEGRNGILVGCLGQDYEERYGLTLGGVKFDGTKAKSDSDRL